MDAKVEYLARHQLARTVANKLFRIAGHHEEKNKPLFIADENGGPQGGTIEVHILECILRNQRQRRKRAAPAAPGGAPPLKILKALTASDVSQGN